MNKSIQMVDLKGQYFNIKTEIDTAINAVLTSAYYINGPEVKQFEDNLSNYLGGINVIGCANGTDALQIALMALGLERGDEVIVPSFTYVATAEVIGLLGLVPIMVDVDINTFNITAELIEPAINSKTKAIVPVHLFGQCVDMEPIIALAKKHDLKIVEDAAQALSAQYSFSDGRIAWAGTMGDIGCTSFFPSKNLGCYGDGGALYTKNVILAEQIKIIANHGQRIKYYHEVLGVNSRLDTLQAAILNVKLPNLDSYSKSRASAAAYYDQTLKDIESIVLPKRQKNSSHVFHQYTLRISDGKRDELQKYLITKGIPSMIYYPKPLFEQEAFKAIGKCVGEQEVSKLLCEQVLSIPMHTELNEEMQSFIVHHIRTFFNE